MDRLAIVTRLAKYAEALEAAVRVAPSCDGHLRKARSLNVRWLRGESLTVLQDELRAEWESFRMLSLPDDLDGFELGTLIGELFQAAGLNVFPPREPPPEPSLN